MQKIILKLSGLSCQNCVNTLKQVFASDNDIQVLELTLNSAIIQTDKPVEHVIAIIEQHGYHAELVNQQEPENLERVATNSSSTDDLASSNEPKIAKTSKPLADESLKHNQPQTTQLLLQGMSCASCVLKVEKALKSVSNVTNAEVNLAERSALVTGEVDGEQLINAVTKAGYQAEIIQDEKLRYAKQQQQQQDEIKYFKYRSIVAIVAGMGLMLWAMFFGDMMVTDASRPFWLVVTVVTPIIMLYCGGSFYRNAWRNLLLKTTTMDTLIVMGTSIAWAYSALVTIYPQIFPLETRHVYFEASLMIIGFICLGKMLETKARNRSSQALEKLLNLTPEMVTQVTEAGDIEIGLAQVTQNMLLRLQTGDRVAVDGVVIEGDLLVDESMLTGEPMPVHKKVGEQVKAGTIVSNGAAIIQAQQIGSQTTLARIINLVRQAQSSKPRLAQLADRVSAVFVPCVIVIAIVTGAGWYLFGPEPKLVYSLVITTSVLIIACPCALGLAIPMSIIAGVARAAEFGILVRDADALEQASKVDTIIFDKTGTLTIGQPKVIQVKYYNDFNSEQVLSYAYSLEQNANHPLAKAILDFSAENNASPQTVTNFKTLLGLGIKADINSQEVMLGNQALMQANKIELKFLTDDLANYMQQMATPVILTINNQVAAMFAIADQVRVEAKEVIANLIEQGYTTIMLTGDQQTTANNIAEQIGIQQVIAEVLPDEKLAVIKKLQQQQHIVAMVGDGINDAPGLAQADVSIALGSGSDVAVTTAALTLTHYDLNNIVISLKLSKAIMANMKQNLCGAFGYNIIAIPIAAGLLYPIFGWLLNPMLAGLAMALSSITVVINANRLLFIKLSD